MGTMGRQSRQEELYAQQMGQQALERQKEAARREMLLCDCNGAPGNHKLGCRAVGRRPSG